MLKRVSLLLLGTAAYTQACDNNCLLNLNNELLTVRNRLDNLNNVLLDLHNQLQAHTQNGQDASSIQDAIDYVVMASNILSQRREVLSDELQTAMTSFGSSFDDDAFEEDLQQLQDDVSFVLEEYALQHGCDVASPVRPIDGSCNNFLRPLMGKIDTELRRSVASDYPNATALAGPHRNRPRFISNNVCDQTGDVFNTLGSTDFLWQWGQFLDHDLSLTTELEAESQPIAIPQGDLIFDANNEGGKVMGFHRSNHVGVNPRNQLTSITSWIDASNVYGSDETRENALRATHQCELATSGNGQFMPYNTLELPNAGPHTVDPEDLFLAGDVRANEQVGLASMHTLFVREHNRLCATLDFGDATADEQYERVRSIVGGLMQRITYNEFLPELLGASLPAYQGYDTAVDASLSNVFTTASYRFGHSALSPFLRRYEQDGTESAAGHLSLANAFFNVDAITTEGIDSVLRGLAGQVCQAVDANVIPEVRNFLFGPHGFDLAALNLQRGRDHGLPSYNAVRTAYGLAPATTWSDISNDPSVQAKLALAYANVDDVDVWVGALAETPINAHMGELNNEVISAQFQALRDGDRFWHELVLSQDDLALVAASTLKEVIERNTGISGLQANVFNIQGSFHQQQ